jgi:hypothetical protein
MGGGGGGAPHLHILILKPTSFRCLLGRPDMCWGNGYFFGLWRIKIRKEVGFAVVFLFGSNHHPMLAHVDKPLPVAQSEKNSIRKRKGIDYCCVSCPEMEFLNSISWHKLESSE